MQENDGSLDFITRVKDSSVASVARRYKRPIGELRVIIRGDASK